jgi:hypothetical protein
MGAVQVHEVGVILITLYQNTDNKKHEISKTVVFIVIYGLNNNNTYFGVDGICNDSEFHNIRCTNISKDQFSIKPNLLTIKLQDKCRY